MSDKSNDQGRAYEYIFLVALHNAIKQVRSATVLKNSSYEAARNAWATLTEQQQRIYTISAESTIPTLFALEPNITEPTDDVLQLYIQTDKKGEEADVRDIVVERKDIVWEIGMSIKHNHIAVKHSRLSKVLDFGSKWYGIPCSQEYWERTKPVFDNLEWYKEKGLHFREIPSKGDEIYVPILEAFMNEVEKQVKNNPSVPRRLVEYLLSKYDFYKVVSNDRMQITTIQSFNMYGTLNRSSHAKKPDISIPITDLPSCLLHIGFKPNSKSTVIMCFDNGWQFSFRIHNAKDLVEASLKFDIRIEGIPAMVDVRFNCKWSNS